MHILRTAVVGVAVGVTGWIVTSVNLGAQSHGRQGSEHAMPMTRTSWRRSRPRR